MNLTLCFLALILAQAPPQIPQATPSAGDAKLIKDVVDGLKSQPAGLSRLDSLNLPDEFLARVADRIVRMDYQKQMRSVRLASPAVAIPPAATPAKPPAKDDDAGPFNWVTAVLAVVVLAIFIFPRLKRSPTP